MDSLNLLALCFICDIWGQSGASCLSWLTVNKDLCVSALQCWLTGNNERGRVPPPHPLLLTALAGAGLILLLHTCRWTAKLCSWLYPWQIQPVFHMSAWIAAALKKHSWVLSSLRSPWKASWPCFCRVWPPLPFASAMQLSARLERTWLSSASPALLSSPHHVQLTAGHSAAHPRAASAFLVLPDCPHQAPGLLHSSASVWSYKH